MLEITVRISDVDFEQLETLLAPQITQSLEEKLGFFGKALGHFGLLEKIEHGYMRGKTKEEKEALLAKLVNGNSEEVAEKLAKLASDHALNVCVEDIHINSI